MLQIEKKMKKTIDKSRGKWYYIYIYRYFCAYLPRTRALGRPSDGRTKHDNATAFVRNLKQSEVLL